MKKVNVFIIGLILTLSSSGVNAQTPGSADFFAGNWDIAITGTPEGDVAVILHLERVDGKLQGYFKGDEYELKIDAIEEKETSVTLFFVLQEYDLNMLLEKVDDKNIKGNMVEMFDVTGIRIIE